MNDEHLSGLLLFVYFFILYGLEYFFPLAKTTRKNWWTNIVFGLMLFVLNIASTSLTIFVSNFVNANHLGLLHHVGLPQWVELTIAILFLDLWAGYFAHWISHRSVWLWHFHSIHHTDNHVDVTTTFRRHPIEIVLGVFFNLSGLMLLGEPLWMLLVYVTISTANAQFEHANIRLPKWLDKILQIFIVTPNMHKVHHSVDLEESNSNYSNIFSFWDRLFNTFHKKKAYDNIKYGLDYVPLKAADSTRELLIWPRVSMKLFQKEKEAPEN